ncbi:MAG: T9SS type A sorting domain-containing protein [Bacteroidetes bacterium]|nr:T9SS type A sorting domain-containing protein [Bacteroidota bacterium]
MKKFLLLPVMLLSVSTVFAQTTYKYHFNNNLHDAGGVGPDLIASCTAAYNLEALPIGFSKNVFTFDKGCGLTFDDAAGGFLASGSYTIEMYVKLDTVQGYTKFVDYDARTSDNGFYNQSGKIALYPHFTSDSVISAGNFFYIALTRDATSKDMYIYVNNQTLGKYSDTGNQYIYDTHKNLVFFIDDSTTHHEDVTGAVAMLHISNYAMDSVTVKNNYSDLAATLTVPATTAHSSNISIYPNPAIDVTTVTVSATAAYQLSDLIGKSIQTGTFSSGSNKLDLTKVSAGMYLLHISDKDGNIGIYKIVRQ